jgi:hypothetical protein
LSPNNGLSNNRIINIKLPDHDLSPNKKRRQKNFD